MNLNKLASAILRGTWLMEPRTAMGFMPLAERFLSGEKISWFDQAEKMEINHIRLMSSSGFTKISASQSGNAQNIFADAPEGSVVVIPVAGTIMAEDDCWGSPGTNTMSSWLNAARDAENISGVILHINSGGGTVEGTAEFADVISSVAQDMPVEAYVEGMACSAAYWLASCCSKITASSGTVEFGSIGTAINFTDCSEMYAKNGVKKIYINAEDSFDKNQDYYQAIAGNYQPMLDNVLNPTNAIFLNAIKTNRAGTLKLTDRKDGDKVIGQEPLTGKTYVAGKAIENGLIDQIGTMAGVLSSVKASAGNSTKILNTSTKNMGLFGSDFPKLNALKEKTASAITAEELTGVNAELQEKGFNGNLVVISSTAMDEGNITADAHTNALSAVNTALGAGKGKTTLAEAVTALVAERDAETLRAETYGKQPGAVPAKNKLKKDVESEGGETMADAKPDFWTSADEEAAKYTQDLTPQK